MPGIDKARLRELATMRTTGGKVLSLYISLDPSEFATARGRDAEVQSLLDDAARQARENPALAARERRQIADDIDRVRRYLEGEFSAKGARAVAIFCATGDDLFEVVKLRRPVPSQAVIDDSPFIEPLTAYSGEDGYSVLLISRKSARVIDGAPDQMQEIASVIDDVHRRHDQGGWSQARFQRGIDKEARDHLKHAADVLFDLYKRRRVKRLIIGAHEELYGEVRETLHPYLRERIAGRIDVDVENASVTDVAAVAAPVIEADRRRTERAWLDRLAEEVGRAGRGTHGLDRTLGALNESRVEALLVEDGFRASGATCTECGYLSSRDSACPVDGLQMRDRDDVVEPAVERALGQSAEVVFVRYHDDLGPLGSIGALLRY